MGTVPYLHTLRLLGESQVEALHIQRQADRPGSAALIAVLEPKAADAKNASVTAIAGKDIFRGPAGFCLHTSRSFFPPLTQSTRLSRWSLLAMRKAL